MAHIPGYSNIVEIGSGGMGSVYKATEIATGQTVAIKMMSNKVSYRPEFRTFFETEARTLQELDHPSIVKITDDPFADQAGNYYLPMAFVEGKTITQKIVEQQHPFSEQEAVGLMCMILDTMQYVYEQGKIHRDIKPSNIIIRPDGSVCIIDFGICKDVKISTGLTVGNTIGTDGYMSPEQANGYNIDHRTDIYSLGCTLYYMLTGHDVISKASNDHETKIRIIRNQIPYIRTERPEISENTAAALLIATDKNMMFRFQTPLEFKQALEGSVTRVSKITIGSSADNDYVIRGHSVENHHGQIDIITNRFNGLKKILYIDTSSIGSGVNGKFIKQSAEQIRLQNDLISTTQIVSILLAGQPKNELSWKKINELYRQQTGDTLFIQNEDTANTYDTSYDESKTLADVWNNLLVFLGFRE